MKILNKNFKEDSIDYLYTARFIRNFLIIFLILNFGNLFIENLKYIYLDSINNFNEIKKFAYIYISIISNVLFSLLSITRSKIIAYYFF